jgi:hypothetical protein
MKKLLMTVAMLAVASSANARDVNVAMPQAFHGDWCADGGACPNGWMTVTQNGFRSNDIRCDLKKAVYPSANLWKLTFRCTDSGNQPIEESWFFIDEMLVVTFPLPNGRIRFVQYLPRTEKD